MMLSSVIVWCFGDFRMYRGRRYPLYALRSSDRYYSDIDKSGVGDVAVVDLTSDMPRTTLSLAALRNFFKMTAQALQFLAGALASLLKSWSRLPISAMRNLAFAWLRFMVSPTVRSCAMRYSQKNALKWWFKEKVLPLVCLVGVLTPPSAWQLTPTTQPSRP